VPPYPYRLVDSVVVIDAPLYDVAVSSGGDYVYATNRHYGALSAIRTSDLQVVRQIQINRDWDSDGQVACSPDGYYVYASEYLNCGVAVVRIAGQKVVDTLIPREGEPTTIAVSPDGLRLYFAVDNPGRILELRLSDGAVEDTVLTLGIHGRVTSLKVAPDGSHLYAVADLDGWNVCAIRLSDNMIEWKRPAWLPLASGAISVHPTGDPLYVLRHGSVLVLGPATGSLVGSIPLPSDMWNADLASSGSFLYTCGSEGGGAIAVIRTADRKVVRTIAVPDELRDVAPSPDGQKLYVAGESGKLYVLSR
jgi:DNA-binding beta-propeller fold protein YncE